MRMKSIRLDNVGLTSRAGHMANITNIMDLSEDGDLQGVIKKLDVQPALVNVQDGNGRSPLHRGAESGNMELIRLLLDRGAEINAENVGGHTPLHFGAFAGHVEVLRVLLDNGARIDHQGKDGSVPLHFACGQGKMEAIEYLIQRGANLKIENNAGKLPLDWAVQNMHHDVAKRVNAMYHKRPCSNTLGNWTRYHGGSVAEIKAEKVDNETQRRNAHNKSMGLFFHEDNDIKRSHTSLEVENEEVDALLDKHHPGTPF
jgi:ankyrin repeat protein